MAMITKHRGLRIDNLPDGLADEEVICISSAICWRSDIGALVADARLPPDPLPGVPRGREVDGIPFTF